MWQPILNENAYREKLHEIADVLATRSEWKQTPGLYNGMTGVGLFMAYYDKYTGSARFQPLIEEVVANCFDMVETQWPTATYCSGLSGILWSVQHLVKINSLYADSDFTHLHDILIREMHMLAGNRDFDFLHGSNGIFYYLMQEAAPADSELNDALQKQVNYLSEGSYRNGSHVYWESYINPRDPKKVYNLSLSHGMASTIVFLSRYLKKNPGHTQAEELLNGSVAFLLASKNPVAAEYYSIYPGTVFADSSSGNSRLGWCYGDIGHALAMFAAGELVNQPSWKEESLLLMDHAAKRQDLKRDVVRDAGICHGTSGLAHIFNRFYQATGTPTYRDAAHFWYEQTLQMAVFPDGKAGYKMFHGENGWQTEIDLLEGIAGIGLSILAGLDTTEPDWDQALLLNQN